MRSKDIREHLLDKARRHAEARGISLESIGTKALNDSKFFKGLQDGKGFTVGTFDKVVEWIDAQERDAGQAIKPSDGGAQAGVA